MLNFKAAFRKHVNAQAHDAATSPLNLKQSPTQAQLSAGNYSKGHARIAGLDISIENPAGSYRRPEWPMMTAHYGYFKRTTGNDGDNLDVFIKPNTPDDWQGDLYVIDQAHEDGTFDEHKVMLGYMSMGEARRVFLNHHTANWARRMIGSTKLTQDEFKAWMGGDLSQPLSAGKVDLAGILEKYNPNHDERGRFTTADNATFVSTSNTKAIDKIKAAHAEKKAAEAKIAAESKAVADAKAAEEAAKEKASGRGEFVEMKTSKLAGEWAVANDIADHANYDGVKPEVANAFNQSLHDHLKEFPELRENQRYIGTTQAQTALLRDMMIKERLDALIKANPGFDKEKLERYAARGVKRVKTDSTSYATSWAQPRVQGIAVNKEWGKNVEKFKAALAKDVESGWHPPGGNTFKGVVDHEMGHQLDDLLRLDKDPEMIREWERFKADHRSKTRETGLSVYANRNIKEYIAEAWTEHKNSPNPREIARKVAQIVRSRYADKHPKV